MTGARSAAKRLVLTAVVAMVVVSLGGLLPMLGPGGGTTIAAGPDQQQWSADRVVDDRVPIGGSADPKGDVGVVLFDRSHANRFDNEEISSLVRAIGQAGGEVRFTGISSGFEESLSEADVLVVIDPAVRYSTEEVDAIEEFVDNGGRVLILGEPNRKALQVSGFVVTLATRRARLSNLASRFGVSFSTEYLYDMEHNDGNFKAILTHSPKGTNAAAVEGVERVSMYTAASVHVNRGEVLLRTSPTAERGNDDTERGFPVAVLAADGDVMAVGDKTFLTSQYHTVADNEVFIARIVEFMAGANHQEFGNASQPDLRPPAGARTGS